MRLTHLELPIRGGDPLRLREGWGSFTSPLTQRIGHFEEGGEDGGWTHLTPIVSPNPVFRKAKALSHALLEAATRGQALTSHQEHRNHQVRVSRDWSLTERQVSTPAAQEGPEKEAGSRKEFGL